MTFGLPSSFWRMNRAMTLPWGAKSAKNGNAFVSPVVVGSGFTSRVMPAAEGRRATPTMRGKRSGIPSVAKPVVPSPALKNFVEDKAQRRSHVVKAISAYVREQGLQDPSNKQIVRCNAELTALLGVTQCTMLTLSKHLAPHMLKPESLGGRYVDEAREVEREYYKEKDTIPTWEASRDRRKDTESDRASGRRIFKPVQLSKELAALCNGVDRMPRPSILASVWAYVRAHGLKGEPGTPVRCDERMKRVFKKDTLFPKDVMKGISEHVTKID